jgi:hypothetical protein
MHDTSFRINCYYLECKNEKHDMIKKYLLIIIQFIRIYLYNF